MSNNTYDPLLQQYMKQIERFTPLTFEQEQALAQQWQQHKDRAAFQKLMESYLRLVVKVAMGFRGYGLPIPELVQEGNIGLMQAIARFEPERGFRLSTYAIWWIKASMQEYILNNWTLVKISTSAVHKKLFFNLRKLRSQLLSSTDEVLDYESVNTIAEQLGVPAEEVRKMEQLFNSSDQSLDAGMNGEDESDGSDTAWLETLEDDRPNQETVYAAKQEQQVRKLGLYDALERLDERERMIFISRRLNEPDQTPTLEELSTHLGVSRERVRQLEGRAFAKVQKHLLLQPQH